MTKVIGKPILVTKEVAEFEAESWQLLGSYTLQGVSQKVDLYTLTDMEMRDQKVPAQTKSEPTKSDETDRTLIN